MRILFTKYASFGTVYITFLMESCSFRIYYIVCDQSAVIQFDIILEIITFAYKC